MRNIFIALVVLLAAVAVTKPDGRSGGTGGGSAAGSGSVSCSMSVRSVRTDGTENQIVASGQFRCDEPGPDRLDFVVSLQRRGADGQWANARRVGFVSTGADTTSARPVGERTRVVSAACAPGVYRAVVEAATTDGGKRTEYLKISGSRTNPCG